MHVEKKNIPPKESSRIIAEAKLPDTAGLQDYFITVATDDPAFPGFRLTFSAVVKLSEGETRDYTIGTFHPGAHVDLSAYAESFTDGQVSGVDVSPGAALQASLSGGGLSPLMLDLTGTMPVDVGPFEQNLVMHVSYPEESGVGSGNLVIRVTGLVVSRWNVPDSLYGGFCPADEGDLVDVEITANPANGGPSVGVRDVRVTAEADWISLDQYEVSRTGIDLQMQIHRDKLPAPGAISSPVQLEIEYENDSVERHSATFFVHT